MSIPKDDRYGTVYFISHGADGLVKIGFTGGGDPQSRIRQLQTGAPEELNLLGSLAAEGSIEQAIHTFLNVHRVRGEWFEREPALCLLERLKLHSTSHSGEFVRNFQFVEASRQRRESDGDTEFLEEQVANNLLRDIANQLYQVNTELPLPFIAWLSVQKGRDDPIGDLAGECIQNSDIPTCGSLKQYLEYFSKVRNPAITRTVIDAWIECDNVISALPFLK